MIWDYTIVLTGKKLLPVGTLTNRNLAIELTIVDFTETWEKAGYLYPLINVGGVDLPGRGIFIRFGAQAIQVPYASYKLKFEPVRYLTSSYQLKLSKLPASISDCP